MIFFFSVRNGDSQKLLLSNHKVSCDACSSRRHNFRNACVPFSCVFIILVSHTCYAMIYHGRCIYILFFFLERQFKKIYLLVTHEETVIQDTLLLEVPPAAPTPFRLGQRPSVVNKIQTVFVRLW